MPVEPRGGAGAPLGAGRRPRAFPLPAPWASHRLLPTHPNPPKTPTGSFFSLSIFDQMWHPELSQEEALAMMEAGIDEVRRRLVVAPPHYIIKVVDREGIRTVKVI